MSTPERNTSDIFENKVFFGDSRNMKELPKESVHLIITQKSYSKVINAKLRQAEKHDKLE